MPAATTRKTHTKSRSGCVQCKARKVKCDQARPACTACVRRNEVCVPPDRFVKSRRGLARVTPVQPTPSSPGSGSSTGEPIPTNSDVSSYKCRPATIDLELTHFYATRTWKTLMLRPQATVRWRDTLFDVALDHPQFLDALLATAAMHKLALDPSSPNSMVYVNVIMCKGIQLMSSMLSMLRTHAAAGDCTLLFASSILVTIWAFAAVHLPSEANLFITSSFAKNAPSPLDPERAVTHMPRLDELIAAINISSGSRDVAIQNKAAVRSECFLDLVASPPDYELLPPVAEDVRLALDVLEVHWKATTPTPEEQAIYKLQMCHLHELFRIKQAPEWHDMIVGFVIRFPKDMLYLLAGRDPCALVILAYWTAVLRDVEDRCWWLTGWSEELYAEIEGALEPEWNTHLRVLNRLLN